MAQTATGALKIAAKKAGVSLDEYQANRANGKKWCTNCRQWHATEVFSRDASRWDELTASCRESRLTKQRENYVPHPGPKGRPFKASLPRDGDRLQARATANRLVKTGIIPKPADLPCTDCGHFAPGGQVRHEYDHYLGYEAEHHTDVQAVCSPCHHRRSDERGESRRRHRHAGNQDRVDSDRPG